MFWKFRILKIAGKKLPEFDLYQTTVIPPNHHDLDTKPYFTKCTECPECRSKEDRERFNAETARVLMPYCSVISDMPFVMNKFDHLEGIMLASEMNDIKVYKVKMFQRISNLANEKLR